MGLVFGTGEEQPASSGVGGQFADKATRRVRRRTGFASD
jgi:hypothetical protein